MLTEGIGGIAMDNKKGLLRKAQSSTLSPTVIIVVTLVFIILLLVIVGVYVIPRVLNPAG
ncbi:hypothetical protein HY772_06485 [Candidatus Woesearchaeota archaeon]|nr:hypothetical protein [Candidatus Woesearchaeota archaeon]